MYVRSVHKESPRHCLCIEIKSQVLEIQNPIYITTTIPVRYYALSVMDETILTIY